MSEKQVFSDATGSGRQAQAAVSWGDRLLDAERILNGRTTEQRVIRWIRVALVLGIVAIVGTLILRVRS